MSIEQLLVLVVFGVFTLLQWMARRVAGQPRPELEESFAPAPEDDEDEDEDAEFEPWAPAPPSAQLPPQQAGLPPHIGPLAPSVRAEPRVAMPPPRPSPKRATSPLPQSPAELRRAVELMVILGPPRALDPPTRQR